MEHTQFSDNYRAAYLSVANMVLQTHGWIRVVTPHDVSTVQELSERQVKRILVITTECDLALISINLTGNAGLKTAPFDHVAAYAPTWDATVEAHRDGICVELSDIVGDNIRHRTLLSYCGRPRA